MRPSGLAKRTILIISNEEIDDIIKVVKSVGDSVLLIKNVSQPIKNETKEQKSWFLNMLLDTLIASLLGMKTNIPGSEAIPGKGAMRACEETIRPG